MSEGAKKYDGDRLTVGLISDTHGLVRKSAVHALQGVDRLLHAGDIDTPDVLDALNRIAPVCAVRGNMDGRRAFGELPESDIIEVADILIYLIHDRLKMDLDPVAAGISVVVSGHSHRPLIEWREGVLYFNPGSAGPRRFELPVSVGLLHIDNGTYTPEIIELSN